MKKLTVSLFALLALVVAPSLALAAASIVIVNVDAPGEGFNDPTPVAPAGGNTGTTLGQQRLIAFQYAAALWGAELDSNVEIRIQASFDPLPCTATGATLGAAGSILIFRDFGSIPPFPGPLAPSTWHHGALANKRSGIDQAPPGSVPPGLDDDLIAFFNSSIGTVPGCLTGLNWSYRLDAQEAATEINLVAVLLHEFAHGLGFSTFARPTGAAPPVGPLPLRSGLPDVYNRQLFDNTIGLTWPAMTDAQRSVSAVNNGNLVWIGPEVNAVSLSVLGLPVVDLGAPGIAQAFPAAFGPRLTVAPVTDTVVAATDVDEDPAGALFTTLDGCSPFTNAAAVAGNIALVDRGGCGFLNKAQNAQAAGATGVIVANSAAALVALMAGGDPSLTIPSVLISQGNGAFLRANLPLTATLRIGHEFANLTGTDAAGHPRVFAPTTYTPGSSISHWDTVAQPNQIMEPAINADLPHAVDPPEDLTLPEMRDVGWFPDADTDGFPDAADQCDASIQTPTVVIDGCDSGVPNTLLSTGCTISDEIAKCAAGAGNHGGFVSCVTHFTNELKKAGIITGAQKGAIQSCAGGAAIP